MKKKFLTGFFLCLSFQLFSLTSTDNALIYNDLKLIYEEIIEKAGYRVLLKGRKQYIQAPALKIRYDRDQFGANYNKAENTIEIEEKLYQVCKAVLGEEYKSGLAFFLGHELTHFYFQHAGRGFLMNKDNFYSKEKEEKEADINGSFLAYLAGYEIEDIVPKLLNGIYEKYNLSDKIANYPSLEDRKKSVEAAMQEFGRLKTIYKTAHYLAAAGDSYSAAILYGELLKKVNYKELNNNLAAANLIAALKLAPEYWEKNFAYPLTIDHTGILRPVRRAGAIGRKELLEKAEASLEYALQVDPEYLLGYHNLIICYILQRKFDHAREKVSYLNTAFQLNQTEKASLLILEGVLTYYEGNQTTARNKFKEAASIAPNNQAVVSWAERNIAILNGQSPELSSRAPRIEEDLDRLYADSAGKTIVSSTIKPNTLDQFEIKLKETEDAIQYSAREGYPFKKFSEIYIIKNKHIATNRGIKIMENDRYALKDEVLIAYGKPNRAIRHTHGVYLIFDAAGLIFNIDSEENLKGWAVFR